MWRLLLVCVLVSEAAAQLAGLSSPRVQVKDGKLRGKYVLTRQGRKVRAFLGIPYASPPEGDLRFKSPTPPEPWESERWAVDHPKPCVQPDKRHGLPMGQEDCLYLNVYTLDNMAKAQELNGYHIDVVEEVSNSTAANNEPGSSNTTNSETTNAIPEDGTGNSTAPEESGKKQSKKVECPLLPVMVFFHGGSLEVGFSEQFTHEFLLDSGVVVVTVQYRLGLLGFFSTGDAEVAGNMGFKDQRLALRWVHDNIAQFGGCPERVTIVGDGVGGASVHYHMLFTDAKKAPYRAGISMSGTATAPWAFRPPAEVAHLADRVASLSGCPRPSQELADCLRDKLAGEFVPLLQHYKNETLGGCGDWAMAVPALGGVLESPDSEDAFITRNPWEKRVTQPWMVGVTSKEMLYEFTPHLVDRRDRLFKEMDKCFNATLPTALGFTYSIATSEELTDKVRSFYFQNKPLTRDLFAGVIDAVSDGLVVYPVFEAVRRAPRRSTWLYHFDYIGSNTYGPSALDGRIAAGRGDDLFYLFPRPLGKNIPRKNKDPDMEMSSKMIKLWTNFARYMDPSPEQEAGVRWLPIAPSTTFLNIAQESLTVERPFLANRMNFWAMEPFPHRDDYYDAVISAVEDIPTVNEA